MNPTRGRRPITWPWIAASVLLPIAVPTTIIAFSFLDYAMDYAGICGPHPTDIPAHPCPREQYLEEFFSPFAVAGMFMIFVFVGGLTALPIGIAWMIAGLRKPRAR